MGLENTLFLMVCCHFSVNTRFLPEYYLKQAMSKDTSFLFRVCDILYLNLLVFLNVLVKE